MLNVKNITENCIAWIKNWFDKNGSDSPAVIGISGGKDSSVVAALCVKALGKDKVIGVQMPQGVQPDIDDSNAIIEWLGIKSYCVDIDAAVKAIASQIDLFGLKDNSVSSTNIQPRIRMTTLYNLSQRVNGRVANTCNLSEDYVGWSTKWGDSCGDFSPISKLTCSEVIEIGEYLGIPEHLIHKVPSDGLCGKTDEDKFGFSYKLLDDIIRHRVSTTTKEFEEEISKILKMHLNPVTKTKLYGIDSYNPLEEWL